MIALGIDDFTVMAISGHRSVRMLERYTHPTTARKLEALTVNLDGQNLGRTENADLKRWWTARGSNSRPPHCERGALPTELAAHYFQCVTSRTPHTSRGAHPVTVALGTCRGNCGLHAAAPASHVSRSNVRYNGAAPSTIRKPKLPQPALFAAMKRACSPGCSTRSYVFQNSVLCTRIL